MTRRSASRFCRGASRFWASVAIFQNRLAPFQSTPRIRAPWPERTIRIGGESTRGLRALRSITIHTSNGWWVVSS